MSSSKAQVPKWVAWGAPAPGEGAVQAVECLVIGGGVAGLAAAAEAARWGAQVLLVEAESPARQTTLLLPEEEKPTTQERLQVLAEEARSAGATLLYDALAWAVFQNGAFGVVTPAENTQIAAGTAVVATGAQWLLLPFPGWHLPGVMTVEEALALLRGGAGRGWRWAVAGANGLGLQTARAIIEAGATVVGVAEALDLPHPTAEFPLWRNCVPLRAEGRDNNLHRVVLGPLQGGEEVALEAEALCIAWGRRPRNELLWLCGCQMALEKASEGYVPRRDPQGETSVPGVFAVGDAAGPCDPATAEAEGRLAGLASARRAGRAEGPQAQQRFEELLTLASRGRGRSGGDAALAGLEEALVRRALEQGDTLLCRCEAVPASRVRWALQEGAETPADVKRFTRIGMGECQGRFCRPLLSRAVSLLRGVPLEGVEPISHRPPVRPVPLTRLL